MTTDNDKAPEWMTEEWLASAKLLTDSPTWEWTRVAGAAREILRLRAELAKRTAFIASLPNLKEAGEMCKQAAAELATLTAELATLREHADHDAGEILRLGGELAKVTQERDDSHDNAHELTGCVTEARGERDKALAERDAARAERDALHKSYVAAVDERDAALACKGCGGTVSHHLAPDQGGCPGRFVIDGVPMVPVAHVEAARAEVERLNHLADAGKMAMGNVISALNEAGRTRGPAVERIRDLACERDAAIRAKHEFAAGELERFARDTANSDHDFWQWKTEDSAKIRAAELRKAAGSVPAGERIRPFSEWSEFDGEALWFHLPVVESAFYVGRPDDSGWPYDGDPDGPDDSDQIGWVPVPRLASDGSELLRKAAPSTEGQPSILPLVRGDGRTLRVGAIAGGAHPGGCKAAGAEVCGGCGATSAKDAEAKCRPDGDSCPGVELWGNAAGAATAPIPIDPMSFRFHGDMTIVGVERRDGEPLGMVRVRSVPGDTPNTFVIVVDEAAGAAAPVGPSTNALIQGVGDAASDWCRCVCDYREACRDAPEDGSCDAVRESGRKCDIARGVLDKAIHALAGAAPVEFATTTTPGAFAFLANEPDVYATPAADARQPDDAAKLAEVEKREADGIKLFDDLLATERAKVATMSIELDGMRNRIAASEKARAVMVAKLKLAEAQLGNDVLSRPGAIAVFRDLIEAAERAGGAS